MNRPIKFRAWDVFYKKFIYSDDCANLAEFWAKVQGGLDAGREVPIEQFTGLLDKNGKEIYEGDVVKHRFEDYDEFTNYAIEWKENDCQFRGEEIGGERHNLSVYKSMEVIGNIYENPELLSEGKEKVC